MTPAARASIPEGVEIIRGRNRIAQELGRPLRAPMVAIGNFDGVHLGHQGLIGTARQLAQSHNGEAVVLTFDPHPARFFAPALAPPMLMTLDRRLELLGQAGADIVVVEPFTADFASLSGERFVAEVLGKDINAQHVAVGADFSFGAKRQGNTTLLRELGTRLGIGITVVQPIMVNGLVCSSTKIREFVLEGRVDGAAMLLGRSYETTGRIVHGLHRGRSLGFPTANLQSDTDLVPKSGVYAAWAVRLDGERPTRHRAAVSVGNNPTFAPQGPETAPSIVIEAHLLDFDGDLYGTNMRLEYVSRIRPQRTFAAVTELCDEIRRDLLRTRELLP